MFPLSQKRKFARIGKLKIQAEVVYNNIIGQGMIEDLSATGCKIVIEGNNFNIPVKSEVKIKFKFHGNDYEFIGEKVRENAYKFLKQDKKTLASLNSAILTDYFKDEPELREVILSDK